MDVARQHGRGSERPAIVATTRLARRSTSPILHAYGAPLPASYSCMDLGKGRIIIGEAATGGGSALEERLAAVSIG